jgi:uncharacterized damage-inducible protein DinB
MDKTFKEILWNQFGGSIDMFENAIKACPDDVWGDRSHEHEYWYIAYHTLFWLDFYLSESPDGFSPPEPFNLDEMDPAGIIPEQPYSKEEMLSYLLHCRNKLRSRIENMTEDKASARFKFNWMDFSITELMLYNMRHVQHHGAQLNLILRQKTNSAPGWVGRTKSEIKL